MEIKNKLTVTRREGEGSNRGKKERGQVKEHVYKGPMDRDKVGGLNVGEGWVGRAGKRNGGKVGETGIEQQF